MFEDRPSALVGIKLTVLSLARHCPRLPVIVWAPDAPEPFLDWAKRLPNVQVRMDRSDLRGQGWDVKASVLLTALNAGHDAVLWLDSDIIVNGDLDSRLSSISPEVLVAAEEFFWADHQGTTYRTTGLGLVPSRIFNPTINTGLLRVSRSHLPLLSHWSRILASPDYVAAQSDFERPIHFFGDQEVLAGLLGSSVYARIPVSRLRRGIEIAQCFGPSGFTVRERLRSGRSLPLLVHAMGRKPWPPAAAPARRHPIVWRRAVEAIHQDLTPYVEVARTYRDQLGEDATWLEPRTRVGAAMTRLLPDRPALRELPLAAIESLENGFRRTFRIDLDKVGLGCKHAAVLRRSGDGGGLGRR